MVQGWRQRHVEICYEGDAAYYQINDAPAWEWVEAGIKQANWTANLSTSWPAEIHVTANERPNLYGLGPHQNAPITLVLLKPDGAVQFDACCGVWDPDPTHDLDTLVANWLRSLESRIAEDGMELRVPVELACDAISRFLADLDGLGAENRRLRAALDGANAEIEQLRLVQHALIEELRKPHGPEPRSSKLLAKVAVVLLSVVGGAAGGISQEVAARMLADDQPSATAARVKTQFDIDAVVRACNQVVVVAEG